MFQSLKDSLLKAVIGVILFAIIHSLANVEFIRKNAEDHGFDLVNKMLEFKHQKTDSPHVLLFSIDEHYLRHNNLLDQQAHTNYGYVFPRDKIAQFIQKIDAYIKTLTAEQQPKALFIDYDFSYGSDVYGKVSKIDKKFIDVLTIPRDYIILLPKTLNKNFISHAQEKNKRLKKLIADKKIQFASVGVTTAKDGVTRRYLAYDKDTNIPSAVISLWHLAQNKPIDIKAIKQQFHDHEHNDYIVENRIFFKAFEEQESDTYRRKQSYWDNLTTFSANYPLDAIPNEHFSDAILMLGAIHKGSGDIFTIYNVLDNKDISGVETLGNALMTLFHLNGSLQAIDLITGLIIVFILIFIINVFSHWIIEKYFPKYKNNRFVRNFSFFIFIMIIMVSLSIVLLNYQIWFNWVIPVLILEVIEVIDYIKFRYQSKGSDSNG